MTRINIIILIRNYWATSSQ